MNLASLTSQAQTIRRQPMTPASRPQVEAQLEALRQEAAKIGAGPALDATLRTLFHDVYGGKPMPPVKLTFAGNAQNASFGGAKGSALQFHALQSQAAAPQAKMPGLETTTSPSVPIETQFAPLSAAEKKEARAALEKELGSIKLPSGGKRETSLDRIKNAPSLSAQQKERLLDVLAEVKHAYAKVGAQLGSEPGGVGYQDVNWKHTRIEVVRVLDVVAAGKLSPHEAETALLASVLSDSVKTPKNFLVHNVHGAQAAQVVLSRLVPPPSKELVDDVIKATLEHQIGPPGFMANVALSGALRGAGVDGALIATIAGKVSKPFDAKHLTADKAQIAFTPAEKEALAKVGVLAWTVPHEGSRHYKASRAVIDGDSLVNYSCPDGFAKLAALHGPGQPPFLQEPLWKDALLSMQPAHASALKSFHDAQSVVSPSSREMYDRGLHRTKLAIDRVEQGLARWVKMQPKNSVPLTKDGKVPYFDGKLDYMNARQVHFATRLRDEAVRLLREQEYL
jgi:hypothetical protein